MIRSTQLDDKSRHDPIVYQEGKKILGEFFIATIQDLNAMNEYRMSLYDLHNEIVRYENYLPCSEIRRNLSFGFRIRISTLFSPFHRILCFRLTGSKDIIGLLRDLTLYIRMREKER